MIRCVSIERGTVGLRQAVQQMWSVAESASDGSAIARSILDSVRARKGARAESLRVETRGDRVELLEPDPSLRSG